MQRYFFFGVLILLPFLFFSCRQKNKSFVKQADKEIEIQKAKPIHIIRFDSLFFDLNMGNFEQRMQTARKNYPDMYKFFVENITEAGRINNPDFYLPRIKEFLLNTYTLELYRDVKNKYADISTYEKQLGNAFARIN